MQWWQAIILGLVEGITEYLPVSSTGHLILTSALLGLDEPADVKAAVDAFNIIIQGGAILAVVGLYFPRIVQMCRGLLGRDPVGRRLAVNIIIAFIPAAVLGLLFDEMIGTHLFAPGPVIIALLAGGVWMILIDRMKLRKARREHIAEDDPHPEARVGLSIEELDWKRALGIGLFQCVAMWPGTSRSMMTIAGGAILGMKPKDAAEFSFLLGLPTLGGACVYKLGKNLMESHDAGVPNVFEQLGWTPVVIGLVVATFSAALAVKWLVAFLNRHGLAAFGWYRIVLCAVFAALVLADVVKF